MYDCVIIGGGPAGLCAAAYLARFRRSALVLDSGESRMLRIPLARNVPGFPDGIAGAALHALQRAQAERYGARLGHARVTQVTRAGQGFEIAAGGKIYRSRKLILATGVKLMDPHIAELDRAVAEARIRYCPVCDGFETEGKSIAVLGRRASAINEARFLRTYTDRVTFLCESEAARDSAALEAAREEGINVAEGVVRALSLVDDGIEARFADGGAQIFDALYPCLGAMPQTALLERFALAVSASGGVLADEHQRTSVADVYAIGDVRDGLDQIASAWGQAAIAATALHNDLRRADVIAPAHKAEVSA